MVFPSIRHCLMGAILVGAVLLAPIRAGAEGVLVFAAASLKTALDKVAQAFEGQTGQEVTVSYAASSVLARQLQLGAPADVFISANEDWMGVLQDAQIIDSNSRIDLLGNSLVLIGEVGRDRIGSVSANYDLVSELDGGYLAMALVDAVPAGLYGKAALQNLGLWQSVEGQVAQSDNVRAALALVAAGAAPLGIVYRTDATAENRVSIVGEFPAETHPSIIYPAAAIAPATASALSFLGYLQSPEAAEIFQGQGFTLPNG